jgi:hypothetical protein
MRPISMVALYVCGAMLTGIGSLMASDYGEDGRVLIGRAVMWPIALLAEAVRCVWVWWRDYLSGWRSA